MRIRPIRSPGGPHADPTTNWTMRLPVTPTRATKVSIPSRDGVAAAARGRSRRFAWPECCTETFLGRDTRVPPSSLPRQKVDRLDPVNLFGAARCGRSNPNDSDARRAKEAQTYLRATREDVKIRQRERNAP